jgi:hypothetical protein
VEAAALGQNRWSGLRLPPRKLYFFMTHSPSLWSFTVQWVLHSPRLLRASRVPPRRIRGSGRGIPGGSFRGVVFYSLVLMDLFSGSGAFAGWARHSWWQLSTAVVAFQEGGSCRLYRPREKRMGQLPHHAPYFLVLQNGLGQPLEAYGSSTVSFLN